MATTVKLTVKVEKTKSPDWMRLVDTAEGSRTKWNIPTSQAPWPVGTEVKVTLTA